MAHPSAAESRKLEREFVEHRAAVLGMLRSHYPQLTDPEEIYQEAWAEVLELRRRGTTVDNPPALLKKIAWRRARDEHRNRHTTSTDPTSRILVGRPDQEPPIDEQAESRLDSVPLRHIIDELPERQAAVLQLRFDEHRTPAEIQQLLGITPKRMEKIVAAAYGSVTAALDAAPDGETQWRRRQRSVLLACETGVASSRLRRRAQRWVDEDPVCRAMMLEMRAALRRLGALAPPPVLAEAEDDRIARVGGGIWDRLAAVREQLGHLLTRSGDHAQSLEQAGAGLAGTAGAGVAAKVALVCVFAAGGTVVCVQSGLLDTPRPATRPSSTTHTVSTPTVATRTAPPRDPIRPVAARVPARTTRQVHVSTTTAAASSSTSQRPRSAAAPAAPSPAPAGSTEFGPGTVGSSSPPPAPASAPIGGGGEFLP